MVGLNPLMNNVTVIHLPGHADGWQTTTVSECQSTNKKLQRPDENEIHALFEKKSTNKSASLIENFSKDSMAEIMDQNVGVSGRVEMLSEPSSKYFAISEGFDDMIGPYSLLSVHESIIETLTTSHHFTTITIGERNDSDTLNKKVMSSSKSFVLNPPKDKHLKDLEKDNLVNKITADLSLSSSTQTDISNSDNDSRKKLSDLIKKPQMENKQIQVELEWQIGNDFHDLINIPHLVSVAKDERDSDRGSTPSSFSSAYTVTEQEMVTTDLSTSTDTQSDTASSSGENDSHFHSSSGSGIEDKHVAPDQPNVSYVFISKSPDTNKTGSRPSNPNRFINDLGEEIIINESLVASFRLRKNSTDSQTSEGSSASSQRPYQRDKEDDEMWVANEATYSCSFSDYTLQWIAPPIHPQWEADSELEGKSQQNRLLSVVIEERVEAVPKTGEAMTTLICPVLDSSSLQRKHFANRQRIVDSPNDGIKEKGKEGEKKALFWNKENENKEASGSTLTSTSNNRPTKRFSFLIRSNSLKDEDINQKPDPEASAKEKMESVAEVSASDKAILDRLSQLNLEKSSSVARPRNLHKPSQPSCGRCGEPVYPQEVVRPTSELFFHTSCFKCFQCGLRLNVGSFYRCPVKPNDTRIYCRSHLPAPDGRPNYPDYKKGSSPKDVIKCDSIGLRYF